MIRLDKIGPDWSEAADPRFHTYRKDSYSLHSPWFRLSHSDIDFNPSDAVISRVFAPLSRALAGRGGAREVLGWTAVAQCPTLSAKYFSVSLKISICGLTNMAKSTTLPAKYGTVQWWPEVKSAGMDRAERTGTPRLDKK